MAHICSPEARNHRPALQCDCCMSSISEARRIAPTSGRTATLDAARRGAAVRKPDEPDSQFTTPLRTGFSGEFFHEQPPASRSLGDLVHICHSVLLLVVCASHGVSPHGTGGCASCCDVNHEGRVRKQVKRSGMHERQQCAVGKERCDTTCCECEGAERFGTYGGR